MILALIAFVSGILTVFSPCVLPILPIVLGSGIDGSTKRINGVISGLVISFTVSSLLLATLVRALNIPADVVRMVAVTLLILIGLSMIYPNIWERIQAWIEQVWRIQPSQNSTQGFGGGFITGVSLGIVWTPIGPIMAAVATLAAVSSFSITAVLVAFAYALGTAVPLYLIAYGGSKVSKRLSVVKSQNEKIRQIFGVIILITALAIWSGADRSFQAWTLNQLPQSWTQLTPIFEQRFQDKITL